MLCHYVECCYGQCHDLFFVLLNVIMLNVIMLNVIMLNVIMLYVIILIVITLNVVVTKSVCPWQTFADTLAYTCKLELDQYKQELHCS